MKTNHLTVACVVRNIGDRAASYIDSLRLNCKGLPVEVGFLFVDDGSVDQTFERLAELALKQTDISAIRLARSFGERGAVTAAINHSVGDACLVIVGQNQPVDLIAAIVQEWLAGQDIVWATPGFKDRNSRSVAGVTDKLSMLVQIPIDRVFAMTLVAGPIMRIWRSLPHRDEHIALILASYGFKQATIVDPRIDVSRQASNSRLIGSFVNRLADNSILPVRLTSTVGLMIAVITMIYILILVIRALVFDLAAPGWSSLMITILFVASTQIISIGIIAEYLWRVFQQVRSAPRYIIQGIYGIAIRKPDPSWELDPLDLDTRGPFET